MAKVTITRTITQTLVVEDIGENYYDDEKKRNMTIPEVVDYELSLDFSDYAESFFENDPEREEVLVSVTDDNDEPLHQGQRNVDRDQDGVVHVHVVNHHVQRKAVRAHGQA